MTLTVKKSEIARSFSKSAPVYDKHAFLQKEIGKRLLARFDDINLSPTSILDAGSGTGFITRQLKARFPKSQIFGLDLAKGMVEFAQEKRSFWKNEPTYLCGDIESLPFANESFDCIFSNLTLQWSLNLPRVFAECKRVLKPGGLLLFSTLGPQTLYELAQSFSKISPFNHVNEFLDMHDIGQMLLFEKMKTPVIDMEMVTVTYQRVDQLIKDLKTTSAHNIHGNRRKGLTTKECFLKMAEHYQDFKREDGSLPATYEIIYGHARR